MGLHGEVDFRNSVDTGEPEADAIVPITNGEPAHQTNLRRPTENNRARTDILREVVREHTVLADMDRTLLMVGGGVITFGGAKPSLTGEFTIGSNINIISAAVPGDDSVGYPYTASTKATLSVVSGPDGVLFTSKYKQWEAPSGGDPNIAAEANKISVEIQDTGSLTVDVNGATGEENNILIGINYLTTTIQQVVDAVNADTAANKLVVASVVGTAGNACPKFSEAEWGTDYSARFLRGGAAGMYHTITNANLAAFFSAHADNPLRKGDTLAIWYDKLVDLSTTPADDGRFQSTYENTATVIPSTAFFNTRREPEKIPNCIPVCRCVDDTTILFSCGAYIQYGTPASLFFDSIQYKNAENGVLATPLNWDRIGDGPDHNPPTTIRHALDNADGRLHSVMSEVETARTSSIFGTATSLDDRLDAADGHVRTTVSVGTGCMYPGTTGLQDAITALLAGDGGTIFVRTGTYTITAAQVINRPINIIAVEADVIVDVSGVAGPTDALTFSTTGNDAKSIVSGLRFQGTSAFAINVIGYSWVFERLQFATDRGIFLNGTNCSVRNCQFATVNNGGIVFGTNAAQCTVDACRFDQGSYVLYSSILGGNSLRNCFLDIANGEKGLYDVSSAIGLTIENLRVTCRPYTATSDGAIQLVSGHFAIEGLWITLAASGVVYGPVLTVGADSSAHTSSIKTVFVDLNSQVLRYGPGNNPIQFIGDKLLIEGFHLTNIYLTDNSNLSFNEPIVALSASSPVGMVTLRHATVDTLVQPGTPSGDINITLFGARYAWIAGGGPFTLDDVSVNTSALTYTSGTSYVITHLTPGSVIKNCRILGDGAFTTAIKTGGAPRAQILRNEIIRWSGQWKDKALDVNYVSITMNGFDTLVDGNYIEQPGAASLITVGIGDSSGGASIDRVRFTNNTVKDSTAGTNSVQFYYCTRPIAMGNQTTNGIAWGAGVTGQKPDGVTIGLGDVNVLT